MEFGIGIATSHDSWKLAQRAEELGFTHAWFYDTQMITADCFVAMGAAAMKTSRIRLGTGVLVPSNRIAAVTANAFATLNAMAPGRIDFGVGTGFSARRAMGLGAMKLADMEEYIRVVYGLLNGETLETTIEGKREKIRFLNPDAGLINIKDRSGCTSRPTARNRRRWWRSWAPAGKPSSAMSPARCRRSRACGRAGPRRAARRRSLYHRLGVRLRAGRANRPTVRARWRRPDRARRCCCIGRPTSTWRAGRTPRRCRLGAKNIDGYSQWRAASSRTDARYLNNHRGHFVFVKPEEKKFVDAELIRRTTFTATEQELKQRIEALRDAGWNQFVIPITPGEERAIEDWARIKRAFD